MTERRATAIVGPQGKAGSEPMLGAGYFAMTPFGGIGTNFQNGGAGVLAAVAPVVSAQVPLRYWRTQKSGAGGVNFFCGADDFILRQYGFDVATRPFTSMAGTTSPRRFVGLGIQAAFSGIAGYDPVTGGAAQIRIGLAANNPANPWSVVSADGANLFSQQLGASFLADANTLLELQITASQADTSKVAVVVTNVGTGAKQTVNVTANLPPVATGIRWGITEWSSSAVAENCGFVYFRGYTSKS